MTHKADWAAAYRDLIDDGRRRLGEPPNTDELLAYARDELSPEERARIQTFFPYYPELVHALEVPAPGEEESVAEVALSQEEVAADWVRLRTNLDSAQELEEEREASPRHRPRPQPLGEIATEELASSPEVPKFHSEKRLRTKPATGVWRTLALAAGVAALVFGGLYLQALRSVTELEQRSREPRLNPVRRLLLPDGHRGGGGSRAILLPSDADSYLLMPALITQRQFPDYRIDVLRLGGAGEAKLFSATGFRRHSDDTFEIWVPSSFIEPGVYRLELYGLGEEAVLLASYTLDIGRSP